MPVAFQWMLIGITCFTMAAMCCVAMMGVRDVRRYGWTATPNLMGFLGLWLLLEAMGAVALTWMILPEHDWLAARDHIKIIVIAGEAAFITIALTSHVAQRAVSGLLERMISE